MKNIQQKQTSGVLFENPLLERLSKSSPLLTILTYGSVILVFIYLHVAYGPSQPLSQIIAVYVSGTLFWTFAEYIIHRYVFHWITESRFVKRFHYSVHGYHHEFPKDDTRVFMPPVAGIILSSLFLGFYCLILGNYGFIFSAGFINGYLLYSGVHYSTHNFKPPKKRWMKKLWRHHNLHHYRFPDKAFGVSSPLWDYVFGTMPPLPQKKRKTSKMDQV